ncbi:hypothetical protein ACC691_26450 [Rhizobium johnstonii]|uniref:hypothetical protein n=1 Tax=Rhizobium johnstonii TaxID=3019933 RepID=UPI003F975B2D
MRVAWHPERDEFVKASDVEKEYGEKTADDEDTFEKPPARCRVCGRSLTLVRGRPKIVAHFRHPALLYCPTKEMARAPYLRLRPVDPDPEAGARLRRIVAERWLELYNELQLLVPYFSLQEFRTLLRRATTQRMWEYRGLQFEQVARTLVMLADYSPSTGDPGRKFWFRFWYDHGIRDIADLWIRPTDPPRLFRASFEPPAKIGGRPAYEDVIAIKDDWKQPEWVPPLRQSQIEETERWLVRFW